MALSSSAVFPEESKSAYAGDTVPVTSLTDIDDIFPSKREVGVNIKSPVPVDFGPLM